MAKKTKRFTTSTGRVVVIKQAMAPRRHSTTRAIVVARPRPLKRRHHRSGGGSGLSIGGILSGAATHAEVVAPVSGGFIVGKLEENGFLDKVPDIPFIGEYLGKKGSALAIMHVFKRSSTGWYRDVKIALGVLCGYQYAKEGKISGGVDGVR